tara:strand:- start:164 stop:1339 length:1176 start_codon:yes stop_codon:yes gene_type:complete
MNYQIYIKLFFLTPIIFLFFIIKIFKDFRINKIISHKIGHFCSPIEIYICEKKIDPNKIPIIWFMDKRIANKFIKKQWSQKLLILPRQILEPIYILFRKYKFFSFFLVDFSKESDAVRRSLKENLKQIDDQNVLLRCEPSIKFSDKEKKYGDNYLKKIGFYNKKFVTFSSRSFSFHDEKLSSVRNSSINNKISAMKFLVSKGYKSIRMGKNEKEKLNINDSNIIDYATSSDRSDFLDVYLVSKCEFMLSTSSGLFELAVLFRKPRLIVNYFNIEGLEYYPLNLMIMLKKIKNLSTNKYVSFEEVYKKKLHHIDSVNEINNLGFETIENSEHEIKRATENFLHLIDNGFEIGPILKNQKKFWQNIEKYYGYKNKNKTIVCPDFYSNNINLFE